MTIKKTTYVNKNGELRTYVYPNYVSHYTNNQYFIQCPICDASFGRWGKATHVKTDYHKLAEKLRNENPNITNVKAAICEYRYKNETSSSDEEKPQYIKKFKTLERYNRVIENDRMRKDLTGKIPKLVNKIKTSEKITINMREKLKILLIKYPDNPSLKDVEYILSQSDLDYINDQLLLKKENFEAYTSKKEEKFLSNFVIPSTGITCG